ncbi:hypothetical protein HPP92_001024 [Vanilla planifolia]|uniref:DUF2062 domain-containing protein n=1 Tax=Vanilla planifolia TaxID=51239 RepID=A0A835SB73_VANPL|nr:hypothetical protein HPP92_001024 [Vanilla planifolia]
MPMRCGSLVLEQLRDRCGGSVPWLKRKIVDPLMQILRKGAEPKKLAFSTAIGITLGLFPICGVTAILCGMAIAMLRSRCHAPSVMLANFIVTPVELSLVIPFLRLGELLTGGPHFPFTADALKKVLMGQASREALFGVLHALLGWFIASPFILVVLYAVLLPCFKYLVQRFSIKPLSPRIPLHSLQDINIKIRDV